jgi:hypothetical protein
MEAWAKALVEGVNTDAYAKASGALLDVFLTASTPLRQTLEKSMLEALKQLSMPSRSDIVSLAERMTNVEMRLDDLDAKIDQIAAGLRKLIEAQAAPRPVSTAQEAAQEYATSAKDKTPVEEKAAGTARSAKKGSR